MNEQEAFLESLKQISKEKPQEEKTFLYNVKTPFLNNEEISYLNTIKSILPDGYIIQPKVSLESIICRTDKCKFCNELYKITDACIFDSNYNPIVIIEIQFPSEHGETNKVRDFRTDKICEEAGIPIVRFESEDGIDTEKIRTKVNEGIEKHRNITRINHSSKNQIDKILKDERTYPDKDTPFEHIEKVGKEVDRIVRKRGFFDF